MMVHVIGIVSALLGALFTGTAVYVTLVERPAGAAYSRAGSLQTTLAVASGITGIGTWIHGEEITWLFAGVIILAVIPFRSDRHHVIRALLGVVATIIYGISVLHL